MLPMPWLVSNFLVCICVCTSCMCSLRRTAAIVLQMRNFHEFVATEFWVAVCVRALVFRIYLCAHVSIVCVATIAYLYVYHRINAVNSKRC